MLFDFILIYDCQSSATSNWLEINYLVVDFLINSSRVVYHWLEGVGGWGGGKPQCHEYECFNLFCTFSVHHQTAPLNHWSDLPCAVLYLYLSTGDITRSDGLRWGEVRQ